MSIFFCCGAAKGGEGEYLWALAYIDRPQMKKKKGRRKELGTREINGLSSRALDRSGKQ